MEPGTSGEEEAAEAEAEACVSELESVFLLELADGGAWLVPVCIA